MCVMPNLICVQGNGSCDETQMETHPFSGARDPNHSSSRLPVTRLRGVRRGMLRRSYAWHGSRIPPRQPGGKPGGFLRPPMTFDGHEAVQQILQRPVRRVHVCADRIWLHDVDSDAARAEIAGQPARYALQGRLAQRIGRDALALAQALSA